MVIGLITTLKDPQIQGQIRHILTAVGPILAMHSQVSDQEWQLYVGLTMVLLGFVTSWTAVEKQTPPAE